SMRNRNCFTSALEKLDFSACTELNRYSPLPLRRDSSIFGGRSAIDSSGSVYFAITAFVAPAHTSFPCRKRIARSHITLTDCRLWLTNKTVRPSADTSRIFPRHFL